MFYKHLLKPILFWFDPEMIHDSFIAIGAFLGRFRLTRFLTSICYGYRGPDISKTVDGIKYRTPFLLAAGFDYNARLTGILGHIGLGGEEAGSVTARPCKGNPKPRLLRLVRSGSILVNKGLKNEGVENVIERLNIERLKKLRVTPAQAGVQDGKRGEEKNSEQSKDLVTQNVNRNTESLTLDPGLRRGDSSNFIIGISIARTNDEQSASVEAGIEDYAYSFKRLNEEGIGDYYTINISCPNSFGGEAFATPELLTRLLARLKQIPSTKPVYVKMPINIPWSQFEALLKIIDEAGLHGVVIGNLNKDYDSLDVREEAPKTYQGGLSGKPCARLSTDLIRRTREMYGKRFTIIGAGGVMSPETAKEKFDAGADLVQLITGMIFEGPGLIRKLCKSYPKFVRV